MKKLLIVLLLVFAANVVKAQTKTSPKIHLWVNEGEADYTIPNELWAKLGDSRIFNKLGTYGYSYKWDSVKEWDYIILELHTLFPNGNTTSIVICQYKKVYGIKELFYLTTSFITNIQDQHISLSVDDCMEKILEWHDEYRK